MVVGDAAALTAGDAAVAARLQTNHGFSVTKISDEAPEAAGAYDLVVIAESVSSATLASKYASRAVPAIVLEGFVWDDWGLVNGSPTAYLESSRDVRVMTNDTPLAAGLNQGGVYTVSNILCCAETLVSADTATVVSSSLQYLQFAYNSQRTIGFGVERGSVLHSGSPAPAKRIGLGFLDAAVGAGLTTAGWALFDAAVDWSQWSVTLSVSTTSPTTGGKSVLTATTNRSVSGSSYSISVFDSTTGALVGSCPTGTSCQATVQHTTASTHLYRAYVAAASSTPPPPQIAASTPATTVTWTNQWVVQLQPSTTSPNTGTSAALTATANFDVNSSGFVISVFDETSGSLLASCSAGSTCTASVAYSTPTTRSFGAYVSDPSATSPPLNMQASSGAISLSWTSQWTVGLTAGTTQLQIGSSTTLSATASHSVTGTSLAIAIADLTADEIVAWCTTGATCSAPVSQLLPESHTYAAFIAPPSSEVPPPGAQALSNTVTVTWGTGTNTNLWQIALLANPPVTTSGSPATLVATASQGVDGTGLVIQVYDQTLGRRVAVCASGQVCSTAVVEPGAASKNYVAVISGPSSDYPPPDIRAASNSASVTWL